MNKEQARTIIKDVLGPSGISIYDDLFEDLTYLSRHMSMRDDKTDIEIIRTKIETICKSIICECAKTLLIKKYSSSDGNLKISLSNSVLYDENMKPFPEIIALKEYRDQIVNLMLEYIVKEFEKGRLLGNKILKKASESHNCSDKKVSHNMFLETIEIEIMRLENKMKELTKEEIELLLSYYSKEKEIKS